MTPREEERRRIWAAGEPSRADSRLRVFGPRVGGAVMCPACEGGGYVMGRGLCATIPGDPLSPQTMVAQPVKCGVCNGEGLDPNARQGGE